MLVGWWFYFTIYQPFFGALDAESSHLDEKFSFSLVWSNLKTVQISINTQFKCQNSSI